MDCHEGGAANLLDGGPHLGGERQRLYDGGDMQFPRTEHLLKLWLIAYRPSVTRR
jgi:hypothetical protein